MPGPLRLTIKSEDKKVQDYLITPENGAIIGRKNDCDIVVLDTTASRHHTKFEVVEGRWHVRDMNSANGTKLNDQPVTLSPLKNGDEIKVGNTRFVVRIEDDIAVGKKPDSVQAIPVPDGVLPKDRGPRAPRESPSRPPLRKRIGERPGRPLRSAAGEEEVPEPVEKAEAPVKKTGNEPVEALPEETDADGQPIPVEEEQRETRPQRRKMSERPMRRQRPGMAREVEREEASGSRRPSRRGIGAADQKPIYMQPPVWIGAGTAVMVLVVLLIANAGGNPQAVPPPQNTPQAEFDAAKQMYNDAFAARVSGKYDEALPKVRAARELFQKLLDKYPNETWIAERFTNLNTWEKQLGEVEFARENNARREGR